MPWYPFEIILNESSTRSSFIMIVRDKVKVYITQDKYIENWKKKNIWFL